MPQTQFNLKKKKGRKKLVTIVFSSLPQMLASERARGRMEMPLPSSLQGGCGAGRYRFKSVILESGGRVW